MVSGCHVMTVDVQRSNTAAAAKPYDGAMTVLVLKDPPQDAVEVGRLTVHSTRRPGDLQKIVDKFSDETRALGGDLVKIDSIEEGVEITHDLNDVSDMPTQSSTLKVEARALSTRGGGR